MLCAALSLGCCNALDAQEEVLEPIWDQIPVDMAVTANNSVWVNGSGTALAFGADTRYHSYSYSVLDLESNVFAGRIFDRSFVPVGLADEASALLMYDQFWQDGRWGGWYIWDYERNVRSDTMPGTLFGEGPAYAISPDGRYVCIADVKSLPDFELDSTLVVFDAPGGEEVYRNSDMTPIRFVGESTLLVRLDDGRPAVVEIPAGEITIVSDAIRLPARESVAAVNSSGSHIATLRYEDGGKKAYIKLYDLEIGAEAFEADVSVERWTARVVMTAVDAEGGIVFAQKEPGSNDNVHRIGRITPQGQVNNLSMAEYRYVGVPQLMPDGRNLLLSAENWDGAMGVADIGGLRLMDVKTGKLSPFRAVHDKSVDMSFSPDGGRIAEARPTGELLVRSVVDGANLFMHPEMDIGVAQSVLWTRDGAALLYPSNLGVYQWNVGSEAADLRYSHGERSITKTCYSSDSTYLAGIGSTTVKIWRVADAVLLHSIDLPYRYQSEFIVAGPGPGKFTFRRTSLDDEKTKLEIIDAVAGTVLDIAGLLPDGVVLSTEQSLFDWSPDGRTFAIGSGVDMRTSTSWIRVFDSQENQLVFEHELNEVNVNALRFSRDGAYLLTGGYKYPTHSSFIPGQPLTLWDSHSGDFVSELKTIPASDNYVDYCSWFVLGPDNQSVFMDAGRSAGLYKVDLGGTISDIEVPDVKQRRSAVELHVAELANGGLLEFAIDVNRLGVFGVDIIDLNGCTVQQIPAEFMHVGKHRKTLNLERLQSGLYFIRINGSAVSVIHTLRIVR